MPDDSSIRFKSIPDALQSNDQWVCWEIVLRDGKPTKQPINPITGTVASSTDPDTWGSLEDARSHLQAADVDGIGFVFTDEDPFVGIDLDKCRDSDDGSIAPWASRIITQLNSYTERSPSGTGFHILLKGSVPGDRKRRGNVEMYDSARYFTVTGDHVTSTPRSIGQRPKTLSDLHQEFLEPADDKSEDTLDNQNSHTNTRSTSPSTESVELDDQQLLEKARSAANGDDFAALWRGSTAGYDSHSEADMALACHLAFWTGGDLTRMDALFRKSGLIREKWDEQHYADGSTYGEKTIERARTKVTDYYDSNRTSPPSTPTIDELVETTAEVQPTPKEQSDNETTILARRITTQQAAIDDLKQRLHDQQQRIDELETTVATFEAWLATQGETVNHDTEDAESSDEARD